MRWLKVMLGVLAAGGVLAGCGNDEKSAEGNSGDAAKTVAIDVGTGTAIKTNTRKPRIALLSTAGNLFLQKFNQGAQAEARRRGLELTTYDARFDPARQLEQVQNVIQQKRFDAFVAIALDGSRLCPVLSKQAPAQGVVVVTAIVPICNRLNNPEGPELWTPGTLANAGYPATVDANEAFLKQVAKRMPGKHTAAILLGPPLVAGTITTKAAIKRVQQEIPNLEIKYPINLDQTTPDGFAKTQTLLQAHPDVDVVMSIYSDMTVGAIKAIKAAGKSGEIKVFDQGASQQSLAAVRAGSLEMTTAFYPHSYGISAVGAVADAFAGKKVKRWYGAYTQGSTLGNPLVIDKTNVDTFKPEY
jgi:ribose transport system substrate-binding protein